MHPIPDDLALVARMRSAHRHARKALGVQAVRDERHREAWGYRGRTLSLPVTRTHEPGWLRLASAQTGRIARTFWDGTLDAEADLPADLPRPRLRSHHDWKNPPWQYRAELYDEEPGRPISATAFPTTVPALSPSWWTALRAALRTVAQVHTNRCTLRQPYLDDAIPRVLGTRIDAPDISWEPAHGDLHWANLYAPLRIVDWEGWGLAPVGYDAAMLHSHSLLHPPTADHIRQEFPVLHTPAGLYAQLATITELLDALPGTSPAVPALRDQAARILRRSLPGR